MSTNCEDCFDRSVEIPVGPTGATGSTGATGATGAAGAAGDDGTTVLINLFSSVTSTADVFTNLISGTIPANTLTKVGDTLRVEFAALGAFNNAPLATYEFKLTLGGVDLPFTYTTDSATSVNKNAIFGTIDLIVTNLSPFTLRVHIRELDKISGIQVGSVIVMTGAGMDSFRYSGFDPSTDVVGLISPLVSNTLTLRGKNDTASALNSFTARRMFVKLLKQI